MMKVSKRFRAELKTYNLPAYRVAQLAGVNPSTLSKLVCGIERVQSGDDRITRVAKIIGMDPREAFEEIGV